MSAYNLASEASKFREAEGRANFMSEANIFRSRSEHISNL